MECRHLTVCDVIDASIIWYLKEVVFSLKGITLHWEEKYIFEEHEFCRLPGALIWAKAMLHWFRPVAPVAIGGPLHAARGLSEAEFRGPRLAMRPKGGSWSPVCVQPFVDGPGSFYWRRYISRTPCEAPASHIRTGRATVGARKPALVATFPNEPIVHSSSQNGEEQQWSSQWMLQNHLVHQALSALTFQCRRLIWAHLQQLQWLLLT